MPSPFIDLDAASATPLRPEVLEAMDFALYGNPSSLHAAGRAARNALDDATYRLAALLGRSPMELTFTGSATEAVNLGILGSLTPPAHVVASAIEHHAALGALEAYVQRGGRVSMVAPDAEALVHPDAIAAMMSDDTALVVLMAANNEVGTIQPLSEVSTLVHARGARLLSDASAAAGALPLADLARFADLLVLSAAKIGGPKGVGVLVAPEEPRLMPIIHGGGQQHRRRSGTENVAGILGFVRALELADAERATTTAHLSTLREAFADRLRAGIPGIQFHGHPTLHLPGTLHVGIPGIEAETLVVRLDQEGIACSSGAACTAPMVEPSHVLTAMGLPPELVKTGVRFSLGRTTTLEEVERAAVVIVKVVRDLRG